MTDWLMSANAKKYDHQKAFKEQGYIYWRQIRNFLVGDRIYIYCTKPLGKIQYEAIVEEIGIPFKIAKSDQAYYSDPKTQVEGNYIKLRLQKIYRGEKLDFERLHRLNFIPPQGPQRIGNSKLLEYIKNAFAEEENE